MFGQFSGRTVQNVVGIEMPVKSVVGRARSKKLSRYRHAGSKGVRKYKSYSFSTSALDGVIG
jgi:hypothetical protein